MSVVSQCHCVNLHVLFLQFVRYDSRVNSVVTDGYEAILHMYPRMTRFL